MSAVNSITPGLNVFVTPDRASFTVPWTTTAAAKQAGHCDWADVLEQLVGFRRLPDDWDGEGSPAPSREVIDGALALAQYLEARNEPEAQRVIVGVNGTVHFEWHTPRGYLEIEVTSAFEAESRWVPPGSNETMVLKLTRQP